MVRATVGAAKVEEFPLSFNDIIAHTPGQAGRGDATKGMFEHRNGDILVVLSKNPQFVECEARRNGKRTTKTGFTRTGMFIVDKDKDGAARLVAADKTPDGKKDWKPYTGSITLEGNPHRVANPTELAGQEDEGDDDE